MKPQKTVVERGDTCMIDVSIRCRQPEGWYEYIPSKGDRISVYIKDRENKIVDHKDTTPPEDNTERMSIVIPTDLPKGKYTYDIILTLSTGERHTICDENILKIKEDSAYA